MSPTAISTLSGRWFDIAAPDPKMVHFDDIALGLARRPRFAGFTKHFYSVAQHSWNVAKLLRALGYSDTVQLQGLLHDAQEAYMGDVPSPQKALFHGYAELEEHVQSVVFRALGVGWPVHDAVKEADEMVLHLEARDLLDAPLPSWVRYQSAYIDTSMWHEGTAMYKFRSTCALLQQGAV